MIITKDIYLASIYIASGVEYLYADKTDIRHQEFVFKEGGVDTEKVKSEYINGTLMVNAVAFKEAIQRMKSEIHSS